MAVEPGRERAGGGGGVVATFTSETIAKLNAEPNERAHVSFDRRLQVVQLKHHGAPSPGSKLSRVFGWQQDEIIALATIEKDAVATRAPSLMGPQLAPLERKLQER